MVDAMPALPLEGGCRCGRVRFRLTAAPWMETVCHCRGCQRMTASAFSTTLIMPEDGFAVIAGETVVGGLHGDEADHHHCDWCKSWVFTRPRGPMGFVNVRATLIDDAGWFAPWAETQTAEKLPWAATGAVRSFERFPAMDEYEGLIAAYRTERGIA
ncbi:GFA family protein [Novosphingobium sp. JCM 18896]|uniref:GFA family protein n=1 Tax=Novosphingobium sp. JCM 18896 TaxID=2989731 RepID=UPI00222250CD|nr:GFA family protein [Novosphingobium sp. JCM 18896]